MGTMRTIIIKMVVLEMMEVTLIIIKKMEIIGVEIKIVVIVVAIEIKTEGVINTERKTNMKNNPTMVLVDVVVVHVTDVVGRKSFKTKNKRNRKNSVRKQCVI